MEDVVIAGCKVGLCGYQYKGGITKWEDCSVAAVNFSTRDL